MIEEILKQADKRLIAPWKDFKGNNIFEGDKIIHPSGESGIVVFRKNSISDSDNWLVDYDDGCLSRLCLQIGDKGMAIVQPSQNKHHTRQALSSAQW